MRFIQKLLLISSLCWATVASATLVGPGTKPVLYVTQQVNILGTVSTVEGRTGAAVLGAAGVGGSAGSTPIATPAALPSVAAFDLIGANTVSNVQAQLSTFAANNGPALTAAMGAYASSYGFSSMWYSFTQPIMVQTTDAGGATVDTERQIIWSVFVDGSGRGSWADPRLIDPDPSIVHITYYTETLPTDMPAGWAPPTAGQLRYIVRDARTFAPRGVEVIQDLNGAFDQPINDPAFSSSQGFNCLISAANAGCNPANAPFSAQALIAQTGASYALIDYIYALEPDYEKVNDPYCTNTDAAGFCLRARGVFDYTLRKITYCGCAPALFENTGTYRLHLNQYGDRFMVDGATLEVRPLQRFQSSFLSPVEAFSHNMVLTVAEAMALANKVIHPLYGNRLMESEELGPPGEVTTPAITVVGFLQNSLYWYSTPDPTTGAQFSAQALCEADTLTLRFVAGANVGGDPATGAGNGGFQNPVWSEFVAPGSDTFSTTMGGWSCNGVAYFNGVTTLDFFLDGFGSASCRSSMLNAVGIGNICLPGHSYAPPRANATTGEGCAGPLHALCGICPGGSTGIFTEPRDTSCNPQVVCDQPAGPDLPADAQSYLGYRANWGVIGTDCPWIGEVYGWIVGAWSPWSDTCSDNATRTRIVQCMDELGNMAAWPLCIDRLGPPPHDVETGPNYSGCTFIWNTGPWSAWSSLCDTNASRNRVVQCLRSDGITMSDGFCPAPKPNEFETGAVYDGCSYNWDPDPWDACAAGTQTRTVNCTRSNGDIVAAGLCPAAPPPDTQTCGGVSCDCEYEDDFGAFTRHVENMEVSQCVNVPGEKRNATCTCECRITWDTPPLYPVETIAETPIASCVPNPGTWNTAWCAVKDDYMWSADPWSACSVACGGGTRTRDVDCETVIGTPGRYAMCLLLGPEPASSEACNLGACAGCSTQVCDCRFRPGSPINDFTDAVLPVSSCVDSVIRYDTSCGIPRCRYSWQPGGAWSACSAACGAGTQTRPYECYDEMAGTTVPDANCVADLGAKPADSTQACNLGPCAGLGCWNDPLLTLKGPTLTCSPTSFNVLYEAASQLGGIACASIGATNTVTVPECVGSCAACASTDDDMYQVTCTTDPCVTPPECSDGIDNDGDGQTDYSGGDACCVTRYGGSESSCGGPVACAPANSFYIWNGINWDDYGSPTWSPGQLTGYAMNNQGPILGGPVVPAGSVTGVTASAFGYPTRASQLNCGPAFDCECAYNIDNPPTYDFETKGMMRAGCVNIPGVRLNARCDDDYQWSIDTAWSACSPACGPGTQTRTVTCRSTFNGNVGPDSWCTNKGSKPDTSQACNAGACVAGCSTYPRTETRIFAAAGYTCPATTVGTPVLCTPFTYTLINPPDGVHLTVTSAPPFQVWSNTCSDFTTYPSGTACTAVLRFNPAAPGTYSPSMTVDYQHSWTQSTPFCATADTTASAAAPTYAWGVPSGWSACSAACGAGTQTRTVQCMQDGTTPVGDGFCSPALKPALTQACNLGACVTTCVNPVTGGSMNIGDTVRTYQAATATLPTNCTYEDRVCQAGGTVSGTFTNASCELSPDAATCTGGEAPWIAGGTGPVCPAAGGVCTPAVISFGPIWLRGYGTPAFHSADGSSCGTWSGIFNYSPASNPCTMPYQRWGAGIATWPKIVITGTMTTGINGTWPTTICGKVTYGN